MHKSDMSTCLRVSRSVCVSVGECGVLGGDGGLGRLDFGQTVTIYCFSSSIATQHANNPATPTPDNSTMSWFEFTFSR